jgi:lipopolysaccharide transport system ATP-binding protein
MEEISAKHCVLCDLCVEDVGMNAIELVNVTKVYRRYARRKQFATLKSALLKGSLLQDLRPEEKFPALQGVSFSVPEGRTYGIIGRNGSGKSTALKLVAGITKPTTGTVKVQGRISALIELGAGFHPEISGRENVFINGIMLGLSKREVAERFDEIVQFAEMQDFIDAPVKTYSSGMYMRLGFAVAIHVEPDVLLVDEVLAVGDEGFTHKCLDKFGDFKRRGKTILLVTHSLGLVERFCDEALWLDGGKIRGAGDPKRVVGAYLTDVERSEERELAAVEAKAHEQSEQRAESKGQKAEDAEGHKQSTEASVVPGKAGAEVAAGVEAPASIEDEMTREVEGRWGSREIEITQVTLKGEDGQASHIFQSGERIAVQLTVSTHQPTEDFVFGIGFYNTEGVTCYGTNTELEGFEPEEISGDGDVTFTIDSLDLVEGTYKLDVAVHKRDGYPYDYHRQLYTFRVKSRTKEVGIYRPRHTWSFSPAIRIRK